MGVSDAERLFHEAMATLAAGVAVLTARRPDGHPCGLAATSLASFSASPPSVVASVDHGSRCHEALAGCERLGVHLLRADQEHLARIFAGKGDDKFAGVEWTWDGDVPRIEGVLAYLRCVRADAFTRYDHTLLIGDVEDGRIEGGEPLLYLQRRMDWTVKGDPRQPL